MCLDTITKRHEKPTAKPQRAWKVFYCPIRGELKFRYRELASDDDVPRGRWIAAEEVRLSTSYDDVAYASGFHAYPTRAAARRLSSGLSVVEVRVRGITVEGTQEGEPVIVAREMFVPKQKKQGASQ